LPACQRLFRGGHSGVGVSVASTIHLQIAPGAHIPSSPLQPTLSCARVQVACESAPQKIASQAHPPTVTPRDARAPVSGFSTPALLTRTNISVAPTYDLLPLPNIQFARLECRRAAPAIRWYTNQACHRLLCFHGRRKLSRLLRVNHGSLEIVDHDQSFWGL
jgi:hypothetical protein